MVMAEDARPGHAFIWHRPADAVAAARLQQHLEAAGVRVWHDLSVLPGDDWRSTVRSAITDDAFVFVACFSSLTVASKESHQDTEELNLALEQLRRRLPSERWFIPVRLDSCRIPDLDIGGGRTLRSIQPADVFGERADAEIKRLIDVIFSALGATGKRDAKPPGKVPAEARESKARLPPESPEKPKPEESPANITLVSVGILTMVGTFLLLQWPLVRIFAIAALVLAGVASWNYRRRLKRSWTDKSVLISAGATVIAGLYLVISLLPPASGAYRTFNNNVPLSPTSSLVSLLNESPLSSTGGLLISGRSPAPVTSKSYDRTLYYAFPGVSWWRLLEFQRCESRDVSETYPAQGYRGFKARVGVTDTSSKGATVRFTVKANGRRFGVAPVLNVGIPPIDLDVSLPAGTRKITLQTSEHACFPAGSLKATWIDPVLTRPRISQ